jgi:hypothetical protein
VLGWTNAAIPGPESLSGWEGAGIRPHGKRREAPDIPENKIFKIF